MATAAWWPAAWIVSAIKNSVQTDPAAIVTPDDCNPMTPKRSKEPAGVLLTGDELEAVFKSQVLRQKVEFPKPKMKGS